MAQHSPPLGSLISPDSHLGPVPKTPEESASRFKEIREFLSRTEVRAGLMQFAIGALQPIGPNDTPLGALARAGAGGLQAAGRVKEAEVAEDDKEFARQRKLNAENLEQDKLTAAEKRTQIGADATRFSATTSATARRASDTARTKSSAASDTARENVATTARTGAMNRLEKEITARLTAAEEVVGANTSKATILAKAKVLAKELATQGDIDAAFLSDKETQQAAEKAAKAAVDAARLKAGALVDAARLKAGALVDAERVKQALPRTLASKDSGEIRRQLVQALGGFFDPLTKETRGLSPTTVKRLVSLQAEAARIFKSDKTLSIGQSIQKAIENFGEGDEGGAVDTGLTPVSLTKKDRAEMSNQNVLIRGILSQQEGLADAALLGTGAISMGKAAVDSILGQIASAAGSEDPIFYEDTQQAREDLRLFIIGVRNVLTKNKRFIVGEQEIVLKALDRFSPETFFANPATGANNVRTIFEFLKKQLSHNEATLGADTLSFNTAAEVQDASRADLEVYLNNTPREELLRMDETTWAAMLARLKEKR